MDDCTARADARDGRATEYENAQKPEFSLCMVMGPKVGLVAKSPNATTHPVGVAYNLSAPGVRETDNMEGLLPSGRREE